MGDGSTTVRCTAFAGSRRIASGALADVARQVKAALDAGEPAALLVWDDDTGELVELDLRGSPDDVLRRLPAPPAATNGDAPVSPPAPRGPGRPRLGVVAREVTLLPRHWEWLATQPGGASVALRRLVDDARRASEAVDRQRRARDAAYRFMSAMAGDAPDFEEATRAFFAGDRDRFERLTTSWPSDVAEHARRLAASTFEPLDAAAAAAGAQRTITNE
jgi:uncharacterized protein